VIPIVDLNIPDSIRRLKLSGVTNYIPISQLNNQGNQYGVPIMSVDSYDRQNLDGLQFSSFFNLGPLRKT